MDFRTETPRDLVCPGCRGALNDGADGLICPSCMLLFPVVDSVPFMVLELAKKYRLDATECPVDGD